MRDVQTGDVVYHLIRRDGERALVGRSIVSQQAVVLTKPPPEPGAWKGFAAYFRIVLDNFEAFAPAQSLKEIEALHVDSIRRDILPVRPAHHPYATYGQGVRIAQGSYLGMLTNCMIEIFEAYATPLPISNGLPAVVRDVTEYQEGEQVRRERVFFSRNPLLRAHALEAYGTSCFVCGFDFNAAYGPLGDGFIEIHHLEPMSERSRSATTGWSTSVRDVRPLCANCHRMAHRRRPPVSIDELSALARARRKQGT